MPMTHSPSSTPRIDPRPPRQLHAADDDRREHAEFVSRSGGRAGRIEIGDGTDAGEARDQPRKDEQQHARALDVEADEMRRLRIAADRQQAKARGGPAQHDLGERARRCRKSIVM